MHALSSFVLCAFFSIGVLGQRPTCLKSNIYESVTLPLLDGSFLTQAGSVPPGTFLQRPPASNTWVYVNDSGLYAPTTDAALGLGVVDTADFVSYSNGIIACTSNGMIAQMVRNSTGAINVTSRTRYTLRFTMFDSNAFDVNIPWTVTLATGASVSTLVPLGNSISNSQFPFVIPGGYVDQQIQPFSTEQADVGVGMPLWFLFYANASALPNQKICISKISMTSQPCANPLTSTASTSTTTAAPTTNTVSKTLPRVTTVNPCTSDTCLNGGTCVNQAGTAVCSCPIPYSGATCNVQINYCDQAVCLNGGTCTNFPAGDGPGTGTNAYFSCACSSAYTGNICQLKNNCALSSPCRNGATCVDVLATDATAYMCTCAPLWSGTQCDVPFYLVTLTAAQIFNGKVAVTAIPGDVSGTLTSIELSISKFQLMVGPDVYANDLAVYIHNSAGFTFQIGSSANAVTLSPNPIAWPTCFKQSPCFDTYTLTSPIAFGSNGNDLTIDIANGYMFPTNYVAEWTATIKLYGLQQNFVTFTLSDLVLDSKQVIHQYCPGVLFGSVSRIVTEVTRTSVDLDYCTYASDLAVVIHRDSAGLNASTTRAGELYLGGSTFLEVDGPFLYRFEDRRYYYENDFNGCCETYVPPFSVSTPAIAFVGDVTDPFISIANAGFCNASFTVTVKIFGLSVLASLPLGSTGCAVYTNNLCQEQGLIDATLLGFNVETPCTRVPGFFYSEVDVQNGATNLAFRFGTTMYADILVSNTFRMTTSTYERTSKSLMFAEASQSFLPTSYTTLALDGNYVFTVSYDLNIVQMFSSENPGWSSTVWQVLRPNDIVVFNVDTDFTANGDYANDIIVAHDAGVSWLRRLSNDTFESTPIQLSSKSNAWSLALVDVDVDGNFDIVVVYLGSPTVDVLYNTGNGNFVLGTVNQPPFIKPVQVEALGNDAVVVASQGQVTVLRFAQGLPATSLVIYNMSWGRPIVSVGTITKSFVYLDIAIVDSQNDVVAWYSALDTYATKRSLDTRMQMQPMAVAIEDMDGDGDGDIVVSYMSPASIILYVNGESGMCIDTACMVDPTVMFIQDTPFDYSAIDVNVSLYTGNIIMAQTTDLVYSMKGTYKATMGTPNWFSVSLILSLNSAQFTASITGVIVTVLSLTYTVPAVDLSIDESNPGAGIILSFSRTVGDNNWTTLLRGLGVNEARIAVTFSTATPTLYGFLTAEDSIPG